jgi:oligoendopeptidase F
MNAILPEWSLDDLYDPASDVPLHDQMTTALKDATALAEKHQGKLAASDGATLNALLVAYQSLSELTSRLTSFADLSFAADLSRPETSKQAQDTREAENAIHAKLVFIEHELAQMDDADMQRIMADPVMHRWAPWIRLVRAFRDHQLSLELETMLIDRQSSGRGAWIRLFDETAAGLSFPIDDKHVTEAEIMDMMSDPDPEVRRKAGLARSEVLAANSRIMGLILNTIAKDKQVDDTWRNFTRPVSSRNLANDVEDVVVDQLANSVTAAMPNLSHRYYLMKARWMGKDQLDWWDRNAPVPGDDDRVFTWDEARAIILDAFGQFDPMFAQMAEWFFDRNWIDAPTRSGKASGAFSHPTVPSAHPYILVNFHGKVRDVMTLAHELGHGIHQLLAADQGHLMAGTPLTLAETASVFGEMLVFNRLMEQTTDSTQRRALLAGKIEDMLNTVVRQIGFHNFETRIHDMRQSAELMLDQISDIWMETQSEALGSAIRLDDTYRPLWGFIPHFIHVPFYVYAYAFGDGLVGALWQKYQHAGTDADRSAFVAAYQDLLRAGGTKRHDEALAPFGLDTREPAFWSSGLDMIAGMIDQLENELSGITENGNKVTHG